MALDLASIRLDDATEYAELQALVDREEITDVLMRYCRGIDRLDKALVRSVFHDDAVARYPDYHGNRNGFIDCVWPLLEELWRTQHLVVSVQIELDGDMAYSETYCLANHLGPLDPTPGYRYPPAFLHSGGHRFIDIFERRNGEWRIADRTLVLSWQRIESGVEWIPEKPHWNTDERNQSDLVYRKERTAEMCVVPPPIENPRRR